MEIENAGKFCEILRQSETIGKEDTTDIKGNRRLERVSPYLLAWGNADTINQDKGFLQKQQNDWWNGEVGNGKGIGI